MKHLKFPQKSSTPTLDSLIYTLDLLITPDMY